MKEPGPSLPISVEKHKEKYRLPGESFREGCNRIANVLSDGKDHYYALRDLFLHQKCMPAGRIQAGIGALRQVTAFNCFVSGTIADSFVTGHGSIMGRATEAAQTMRMGGGIGYDFSTLRPKGAIIKKLGSKSSGPVKFMGIFDAVCSTVQSAGHRRGAQMGVLRVDHPDIEEFIHAKQNRTELTQFNVSIALTDEFMEAVINDTDFDLKWGGEVYSTVRATNLWDMIMRSTYDWAEPGVLFIDKINGYNNLHYCETIAATNPCGEQPLPPYGACLLGSVNLVKYVKPRTTMIRKIAEDGVTIPSLELDYAAIARDVHTFVRAMDNVIDRTIYPMHEQEEEAKSKRRLGIGVTGLANALEAVLGGPTYGSPEFVALEEQVLSLIAIECYKASIELAKEKGAFPLFDADKYLAPNTWAGRMLPQSVRDDIRKYGIRNSHLTSIAPTGTISLTADNVSSGVEPVFALSFERTIKGFDSTETEVVTDYGYREFGIKGKTAARVTVQEHVAVLAAAQKWIDSAVSKTCNVPEDIDFDDFKDVYVEAWRQGAKGCTTYRKGCKREGILNSLDEEEPKAQPEALSLGEEEGQACFIDPLTGRRECG